MKKRILSLLLSLALLCGLCVPSAFAAESGYSDTQGHWAEEAIEKWSDYGIIGGYGGGLFGPDDTITRAQMAAILARLLALPDAESAGFADVAENAWYADGINRCYAAGIMLGYEGKAMPDAPISREQTIVMLCRALGIEAKADADLSAYTDAGEVSSYAVGFVAAMVENGMVSGTSTTTLSPAASITRAAVVTILDRGIAVYANEDNATVDAKDADGLILIVADKVTVKNAPKGTSVLVSKSAVGTKVNDKIVAAGTSYTATEQPKPSSGGGGGYTPSFPSGPSALTITEDKTVSGGTYREVTITDAVGDGEVTLTGLTIQGDLTIKGGGSNSIKLIDCTISGKVIMAKEGGEAPRLHLTNTLISSVEVQKPAIIEAADAASAVTAVEAKAALEVRGVNTAIDTITVPAEAESAVAVTVTAGSVATVEAKSETTVTGAAGSVAEVVAEAPISVASEAVEKVEIPETAPTDMVVTVTGSSSVEIAVNTESPVSITAPDASVDVSTEQETAPTVTVNGMETHAHKWNDGEVTTAATCEGEGIKTYTCTSAGCSDPAETKTESIAALGHDYGDWTKVDDNNHQRVCANDANHVETAAHGWDDGTQTTAPTCEGEGVKTYTCSVCSGTKTDAITANGHNYGDWTKVDDTNHQRVCANDANHIETEAHIPVVDAAVAATCTTTGLTEGSHCDVCNSVIVAQIITDALTHDFTGAYTYDSDGHWHVCARSADCEETDTKAAHSYGTPNCAVEATCDCGYVKAAGEHTWDNGVETIAPTCEGEGVRTYTCTADGCGTTKTEPIDPIDHSYGDWVKVDDTNHIRTCANDAAHTETAGHSWDGGIITTEPTETTEGAKTYTCSDCSATKIESVPVLSEVKTSIYATSGILRLDFDAKEGYTGTYYVNGTNSYSVGPFYHLANTVRNATENATYSFTVQTTEDGGATLTEWVTAKDVLTVQFDETLQPDVSIVGQADGSYMFVSNNNAVGIYIFTMYSPEGTAIRSWYVGTDKTTNIAPYEGCYFTVREASWSETGSGLESVTATISAEKKITEFIPCDFSGTEVTITENSEAALKAALNAGGKVTLESDVTITNSTINQGGDVVLDLNGHTIDIGSTNTWGFGHGKKITITDSSAEQTGQIIGTAGVSASGCADLTFSNITVARLYTSNSNGGVRGLTIENCEFTYQLSLTSASNVSIEDSVFECEVHININNSDVVFTNCTINDESTVSAMSISGTSAVVFNDVTVDAAAIQVNSGTLTINSGSYTDNYVANNVGLISTNGGSAVIKGGTYNFDPAEFVDTGNYNVTINEDSTWTVTSK